MHIAFFGDQHPASLGGLQVSLGLQRKYLEAAGHRVTSCTPDSKVRPSPEYATTQDVVLKSVQVKDHAFCLAGPAHDRAIDRGFRNLPPVDLVHIQADVWGAWNGYRFARRHGLPIVHTMHTNVEVGLPAVVPFPRAAFKILFALQRRLVASHPVTDMRSYLRAFDEAADAIVVPSAHFAETVQGYGVRQPLHVIPTGVDDQMVKPLRLHPRPASERPVFVWPGRISEEKRLPDVIRALAVSEADALLRVYGTGDQMRRCQHLCAQLGVADRIRFCGSVSHSEVMRAMREADAVIQSSVGYETQGLTVYEAISVGTPVLVRDPAVAADLPSGWVTCPVDTSIKELASSISNLAGELRSGLRERLGAPPTQFNQSVLTARMVELYWEVVAAHAGAAAHPRNLHAA